MLHSKTTPLKDLSTAFISKICTRLSHTSSTNSCTLNNSAGAMGNGLHFLVVCSLGLCSLAFNHTAIASGNLVNHSTNITLGQSSDHLNLFSGTRNPAMAGLMVDTENGEHFRFNYFLSLSHSTEFGQVDNFIDDVDELIDILDDPSSTTEPVTDLLERFNNIIDQAGVDGYLTTTTGVYLPGFPFYWKPDFLPGTLSFEANIETQINLSVLADELVLAPAKQNFTTATSAYLKSGIQTKLSVGYGYEVNEWPFAQEHNAKLLLGAKFNIYSLELSKQVFQLQLLDGKDVEDLIEDEYKNNRIRSTGIGLDIGAVWIAEKYRLGTSLQNINAPSFDYGTIGTNCERHVTASDQQSNCYITDYFTSTLGYIKAHETYKKAPLVTVDGSYYIRPNWLVSGSAELSSYDDAIGAENQWWSASTSYHATSYWVPSLRMGYRKNLVGNKLDYLNLGITIADTLNADISVSLKNAEIDGQKAPRGVGFAISIVERF